MKPAKRIACEQQPLLALAFLACVLQVLSFSLPAQVVCYRTDRSPQVEYFSSSCSCRQTARHSDCRHDAPGVPCLEADCTDIHLAAPAAIPAAASRHHAPAGCGRFVPVNERPMAMTGATAQGPACHRRGRPGALAPPLLSVTPASFRLRC